MTVFGIPLKQTIKFTLQLKSGPSLEWESGKIKLSAHLKLVVRPGADVSFTFTQKFKLALNASTQQVTLEADGNPSVNTDLPFNFLHEAFENAIKDGAGPRVVGWCRAGERRGQSGFRRRQAEAHRRFEGL